MLTHVYVCVCYVCGCMSVYGIVSDDVCEHVCVCAHM